MTRTPFAKSNTKAALKERLGLYGHQGDRVYDLLYNEAVAGRESLSHDYDSLTAMSRHQGARKPYKWDELQETAKHRMMLHIANTAGVETRPYYQMGRWMSAVEENWVAEWFLWHSFRHRDNRNQTAAQHTTSGHAPVDGAPGNGGAPNGQYWGTVLH